MVLRRRRGQAEDLLQTLQVALLVVVEIQLRRLTQHFVSVDWKSYLLRTESLRSCGFAPRAIAWLCCVANASFPCGDSSSSRATGSGASWSHLGVALFFVIVVIVVIVVIALFAALAAENS